MQHNYEPGKKRCNSGEPTTPTVERYVVNPFSKRSENGKFAFFIMFCATSELLKTVRFTVYKYHNVTADNRSCGKSAMMGKLRPWAFAGGQEGALAPLLKNQKKLKNTHEKCKLRNYTKS